MRCIGGLWGGKDWTPQDPGGQWLNVQRPPPPVSVMAYDPVADLDIRIDTYRRHVIACRPTAPGAKPETVEFWVIEGMPIREALERLLRLYRPPLKIDQYGEEQAPR